MNSVCPQGNQWLRTYNLITINDLSTSSDIEGISLVGRDIVSSSSANFAIKMNSLSGGASSIILGRNVTGGNAINVNHGSIYMADLAFPIKKNSDVQWRINARDFNMNAGNSGGKIIHKQELGATVDDVRRDIFAWSVELDNLPAGNTYEYPDPTGQPGPFKLKATYKDSKGVAVFNIQTGHFFGNTKIQQIEVFNTVGAAMIIVNVQGTNLEWKSGNMVGSFLTGISNRAKILWNFPEATSINMQSRNFMGGLLAPGATVTTRGNIDGVTAVGSLITSAEVHLPNLINKCPDNNAQPPVLPQASVSGATTTTTTTTTATTTRYQAPRGCCSGNHRDCHRSSFCNANSNNCLTRCGRGKVWLSDGAQSNCNSRWHRQCTTSSRPCCSGLTCRYNSCRPI